MLMTSRSPFDEAISRRPLVEDEDYGVSSGLPSASANNWWNPTPSSYSRVESYQPPDLEEEGSQLEVPRRQPMQQQQQQQQELDLEHALIQERHAEMTRIARDMSHINEIHRDLAHLVEGQQEQVDEIEENAVESHERVERGLGHLSKAWKHQKKASKTVTTLVGGVAIIALLVSLLFFFLPR